MAKRELVKNQYKLLVRLSDELRDQIAKSAETNDRSLNGEVVARLEDSFGAEARERALGAEIAGLKGDDRVRAVQAVLIESLTRENEALRKAGIAAEHILLDLARAVNKAAHGDDLDLRALVEREKEGMLLKKLTTVWSIVRER